MRVSLATVSSVKPPATIGAVFCFKLMRHLAHKMYILSMRIDLEFFVARIANLCDARVVVFSDLLQRSCPTRLLSSRMVIGVACNHHTHSKIATDQSLVNLQYVVVSQLPKVFIYLLKALQYGTMSVHPRPGGIVTVLYSC